MCVDTVPINLECTRSGHRGRATCCIACRLIRGQQEGGRYAIFFERSWPLQLIPFRIIKLLDRCRRCILAKRNCFGICQLRKPTPCHQCLDMAHESASRTQPSICSGFCTASLWAIWGRGFRCGVGCCKSAGSDWRQ